MAQEVHKKLQDGTQFEVMVEAHSHGVYARQGGRWKPWDPSSFRPPYDVLAQVAESLEPGQISQPVEAPGHVFIMKLHRKQTRGYVPLSEVQPEIRDLILAERRLEVHLELAHELENMIKNASEESIDEFIDRCADEIYKRSNS